MKATCFKKRDNCLQRLSPPLFVTVFCGIFYPFISILSLSGHTVHYHTNYMPRHFSAFSSMVLDNSNSPCHTEEELWLQVLSLSRELQDCKASLHHNTLDCISDKIEGIERELDILLDILQGRQDKKTP